MAKEVECFKIDTIHNGKKVEKYLVRGTDLVSMTDDEINEFFRVLIDKLEKAD